MISKKIKIIDRTLISIKVCKVFPINTHHVIGEELPLLTNTAFSLLLPEFLITDRLAVFCFVFQFVLSGLVRISSY